jgi:predicted transcriptional regulator
MLLTLMIHFSSSKDMTNRTRIEIISQILEIANGGVTCKTRIMYKANLSYAQLKEYLRTLSDKDLLSYDLDTRTFKTTERGLRFLKTYSHLNDIITAEAPEQQKQAMMQYYNIRQRSLT